MEQIMLHGVDDWRLDDIAEPEPGPQDALVRIAACGICGTDVSYVHMGMTPGHPIPLGHEMAGVVDWVGSEVSDISVGDRVVVCPSDAGGGPMGTGGAQGGLTPLLHVPNAQGRLFPVPDGMALTTAALAEPLAVGMQSVNQSGAKPGDRVAVFGCGPIGLSALATLADRGIDDVVAIDLSRARLELAWRMGAAHVLDPGAVDVWAELRRIHGEEPFMFGPTPATDIYIEASGADRIIGDVLQHGRVDGTLVVVALHYRPVPTNYVNLLMKQFTVRGSMEYPERFEDAIELLERRDLSALITHRFPLEGFGDGLAVLEGEKDCGKVMITMERPVTNIIGFDFTDSVVLVTGGTSGIGHAIATAFAAAGASVTVTGTRSMTTDYDTDLSAFAYAQLELRDGDAVDALAAGFGTLDVLVNNAGANFPDGLDEWSPEGFSASLAMNVEGAQRLTMALGGALATSAMIGGASVVNLVSMTSFRSTTIVPGYSASKAALLALTRNLAVHWAGRAIRVNAVAPGLIDTPMTAPMKAFPELLEGELAKAAMDRMGTPAEVASAVLFLSSAASAYTTGSVLAVDGGYLAR